MENGRLGSRLATHPYLTMSDTSLFEEFLQSCALPILLSVLRRIDRWYRMFFRAVEEVHQANKA